MQIKGVATSTVNCSIVYGIVIQAALFLLLQFVLVISLDKTGLKPKTDTSDSRDFPWHTTRKHDMFTV